MIRRGRWWPLAMVTLAACGEVEPPTVPVEAVHAGEARVSLPQPGGQAGGGRFRLLAAGPLPILAVNTDSATAGYPPARLADGNQATEWINGPYKPATSWAAVDLGLAATLAGVALKTGPTPAGASYDVQVSSTGASWTTALANQRNTTWGMETKTLPAGTTGRLVRVFWRNSPTTPAAHFAVFELTVTGTAAGSPAPLPSTTASPVGPTPTPGATPTPMPSAPPTPPGSSPPPPLERLSLAGSARASSGNATAAADGLPGTFWEPWGGLPQWVAVPLAEPASGTLAVLWHASSNYYLERTNVPRHYTVEASADSSDGRNGTWTTVAAIRDNPVRSRVDTATAPGARWIRLAISGQWQYKPQLRELEVHRSTSAARMDSWLILGDSITALAFHPGAANVFSPTVASLVPGRSPIVVGAGTGGDKASDGQQKLAVGLPLTPAGSFVGLAFGTNDAWKVVPVATFKAQVQAMIDAIRSSGRTPVLARVPWNLNWNLFAYVTAIDELTAANHLLPGPDLYTWFKNHPEELQYDKVHPTAAGQRSIQRLWAEAAARAYGP